MSMQWYAVHTFTGQENNIKKRLEQMIEREGVQDKFGRILVPIREGGRTVGAGSVTEIIK